MADTRIRSGIHGLDNLIEGGFRGRPVVVVVGSSGTGKTTFTVQYILHGLEQGEQGLYVSLEESPEQIMREAELMGLDLRKHLEKDLFFIHLKGKNFKKMIEEQLPQLVKARADYQIKTRVVIDPMTPVIWATQDRLEQRELIGKLFYTLKELGVVLCTGEGERQPGGSRRAPGRRWAGPSPCRSTSRTARSTSSTTRSGARSTAPSRS